MKNILTDKANENFLDWFVDKYFFKGMTFSTLNIYQKGDIGQFFRFSTTKNAYIIEWLNSLQYQGENLFLSVFEKSFAIKADFMSFEDVTNQTIEVCNKIYNRINDNEKS